MCMHRVHGEAINQRGAGCAEAAAELAEALVIIGRETDAEDFGSYGVWVK
jgi:hypothetical protein